MCDAMFIYALERAETADDLPTIPDWEREAKARESAVEENLKDLESETDDDVKPLKEREP